MNKIKQIKIALYKIKEIIKLFFKRIVFKKNNECANFVLAEKLASFVYPEYRFSEFGRIWLEDKKFFHYYEKYDKNNYHSADRKFFLKSLLSLIQNLYGDTAECGVYMGASSEIICEAIKNIAKKHHLFDSFEGLSNPLAEDGDYWGKGNLKAELESVKKNLADYSFIEYHKGWIPERFSDVGKNIFCFVHIDVDLYQPTFESLKFFYPRMVKDGIIVCDDYGFSTCPGAKQAFDEFMKGKPESIIHVPTGHALLLRNNNYVSK